MSTLRTDYQFAGFFHEASFGSVQPGLQTTVMVMVETVALVLALNPLATNQRNVRK
jgi:hypothetical protein